MNVFIDQIRELIRKGDVRISEHGYDELLIDNITAREVLSGIYGAIVIEEYLTFPKGPCILTLQKDRNGDPIHVVWGIPKGCDKPAVLVTAYRPNEEKWNETFTQRL